MEPGRNLTLSLLLVLSVFFQSWKNLKLYHRAEYCGHKGFEEMELSEVANLLTPKLRIYLTNILQIGLPQMLIKLSHLRLAFKYSQNIKVHVLHIK